MADSAFVQTVPPARATRETFYILLVALLVLGMSSVVIRHNQKDQTALTTLGAQEVSARYDLKPAEQGIFADLLLAYEEWRMLPAGEDNRDVAQWIDDNWPPFTDVLEDKQRGHHQWRKHHAEGRDAYVGISQQPDIAGHFLWILPEERTTATLAQFEVWIHSANKPPALGHLDPEDLIPLEWKRINRANDIKR